MNNIELLNKIINELNERIEDYKFAIFTSGHPAIYNKLSEAESIKSYVCNLLNEVKENEKLGNN